MSQIAGGFCSVPTQMAMLRTGKYRLTEKIILPGDKLLVFRPVQYDPDDQPVLAAKTKKGKGAGLLVTDRSDEEMGNRLKWFTIGFGAAAILTFSSSRRSSP